MKGWRTISFTGVILAAVSVMSLPELHAVLPDSALRWVVLVVALGNMWLRYMTTTPIGAKQ